jgi:hypothetical protein
MNKKILVLSAMSLAFLGYQSALADESPSSSQTPASSVQTATPDETPDGAQPSAKPNPQSSYATTKAAEAQYTVLAEAPPAEIDEMLPTQTPGPEYVWAKGYWKWDNKWKWYGGRFVKKPHPDADLVQGHWIKKDHGWYWAPHHWE